MVCSIFSTNWSYLIYSSPALPFFLCLLDSKPDDWNWGLLPRPWELPSEPKISNLPKPWRQNQQQSQEAQPVLAFSNKSINLHKRSSPRCFPFPLFSWSIDGTFLQMLASGKCHRFYQKFIQIFQFPSSFPVLFYAPKPPALCFLLNWKSPGAVLWNQHPGSDLLQSYASISFLNK